MEYDLDTLEELSRELGFPASRASTHVLEVTVFDDAVLVFENAVEDGVDSLVGFEGTPWHSHDVVSLMTDESSYIGLNELDIVQGIRDGSVLVCERYLKGVLQDRWLAYVTDKVDVRYIEADEEVRIRRRGPARG